MSFNMPITVQGDVSTDSITRPDGTDHYGALELRSVLDLTQIMITLNEDGDMSEIKCVHCDEELNEADPTVTAEDDDPECAANDDGPHEKMWAPLTWAKNIAITFDEENDQIDLAIATGDPRGGWVFRLYRNSEGAVIMHLPHADMDGPHEPIRELHPGTFAIG